MHLLGLETQLLGVGQILPLTATTHTEVWAERLLTQRRTLHIVDHDTLHKTTTFVANLHIDNIARNGHRHKDNLLVVAAHSLTLGSEGGNLQRLDKRIVFSLSSSHLTVYIFNAVYNQIILP